ncbi:tail-specific protease [Alkanindiges hydrocarboniclasticus]|uniref:Tail-specific protease n=1 Tax=Alkanindiges hydrocarboniclasticus TaxID=1907941 RepID=A0A1S8CU77_9GAMM|nr:carboxy terminal-processing peptidase [Alkanindiges hydrocarboniclasticus]ONG39174.1 tail-specific protease [Alkanindiges hydrocarboniclasticus]
MKLQTLACAVALMTGGLFFSHTVNEAIAATTVNQQVTLAPTREQSLVTRQVATLVDRQHYLNMRLDADVSRRVLAMYIDSLDPDHTLFLQSDIDEFNKKYASSLGTSLKTGDLAPAFNIYDRYRTRLNSFYQFAMQQLDKKQNLHRNDFIELDREKAPFFNSKRDQQEHWQKMLVSQLINLNINKEEEAAKQQALKANPALAAGQDLTPPEDLTPVETLKKRYRRQMEQQTRIKSDRVLEKILNATLATYDPHSNYYAPIEAMELNRQTTLALEGIGVSIRPERGNEDYTRIETIVDGGPASKSGQVKSGDRIIGVGQEGEPIVDVIGWPSGEIVGLIRGKRGTKVTLRLLATGAAANQARVVTLTRDVIQEEDSGVRSRVVNVKRNDGEHKIGVIEIPSFYLNYRARREGNSYRSVSVDTQKALVALQAQNVEGVVVDLRNNPGGSLEEVARMLGQFVKDGPVVQIRDGNGNVNVFRDEDGGEQIYSGPLAVIINLASASASEIFSAAIQDYQRGIVIGSTTTGKGTAQVQLDSLAYGQATLTQRKFYRITGGSTQNKGVVPDVPLINIYDEDLGERKAKNALKWDTIQTAPYKREGVVAPFVPQVSTWSTARTNVEPQFVYLSALKGIAEKTKDKKQSSLNIDTRKREIQELEAETLRAENARRTATGLQPYANWESYQAALDARSESRAKMKAAQRPPLPEDEAFITESANILMDMASLQKAHPEAKVSDASITIAQKPAS